MRPAKKERPLTTASPDRAEAITAKQCGHHPRVEDHGAARRAHLLRPEHAGGPEDGIVHRLVGHEFGRAHGRQLNPVPVCESAPSPAMASTDKKAFVRRRDDEMPVVEASATSTRLSE